MELLNSQKYIGQEHYLGTANFGQSYGLTRIELGLSENVISELFESLELSQNIHIDTSPDYGSAELIMGKLGKSRKFMESISTKFHNVPMKMRI